MLVSDPVNIQYLTGFTGSAGHLLVGQHPDDDLLITDDRYEARATSQAPDVAVSLTRSPLTATIDHVRRREPATLAVEADHLTWARAREVQTLAEEQDVRILGTTGAVATLRETKDVAEIARLQRANQITVEALAQVVDETVVVGRTERQVASALEARFVELGADGVAFPSIVASGPNSASAHHDPTDRRLSPGDLVTIDCGARVDGYHADHTRTFAIGTVDPQLREIYELVQAAQQVGRDTARSGTPTGEVDRAARAVIEESGYGHRFLHGTGHGVGLQIHEAPAIATGATAILAAGTAFTVEPGVYVPDLGGVRIEDSLVIDLDSAPDVPARVLADAPRELRSL